MADQVVDNLLVELKIRMTAFEQGLAAAEDRIDQFASNTKDGARQQSAAVKASAQEQSAAYAGAAAAATAAFAAIVAAIKSGIDAANQYTSAMVGLRSIADGTGQNFGSLQSALNDLSADGLIPVSDAATALKNLLSRGFDAQESIDILNRLKDSAAFGRQSSLSLGEAVRSASEGLRAENSVLVDNAGVQKNVAKMWEDYAKQIGKSTNDLTLAEKRQAEYNGIMQETRFQIGDAQKYAATFAGTQAELGAATLKTEQAFGSAMQNGLRPFLALLTPITEGIGRFVQKNPELAATLTAGTVAFTGLTIVVNGYRTAMALAAMANVEFTSSLGVVGIIAGVISVIVGIAAAAESAAQSTTKYTQTLQDNITAAQQEEAAIRGYQALMKDGTTSSEQLTAARQKIIEQSPELITGYDAEGNAIIASDAKLNEHIKTLNEAIKKEKELMLLRANETISTAQKNIAAMGEETKAINKALEDQENKYKATVADIAELQRQYNGALASGDVNRIRDASILLDQAKTDLNIAVSQMTVSQDRLKELDDSIKNNQADITRTRAVQYEQEVQSLGKLSAAQQLIVSEEQAAALARGDSVETFTKAVEIAIENAGRLAEAEKQVAAASVETTAAIEKYGTAEKAKKAVQDANDQRLRAQELKQYVAELRNAEKGSKAYDAALTKVAGIMGFTERAIEDSKDGWDGWITTAEQSADAAKTDVAKGIQAVIDHIDTLGLSASDTTALLQVLALAMKALGADVTIPKLSGGGGSAKKKPWEEELAMIDRVKENEGEYAQVYLDHINELLANEKLSAKERQRLEKERQYAVLQVNNELEQANIGYLERLLQREKLTADQRLDVEKRLYEARKGLMEQYDDFADAITSAITASVEAQRDAELQSIQDSLSAVSTWQQAQTDAIKAVADAKIDAINEQIAALDALYKAQTREDQDAQDADKLARLQQQLAYEKDGQNRQKLQEQINALEASTAKRHQKEQVDDQKDALKAQITAIQDSVDAQTKAIEAQAKGETDALNARLKAAQDYWTARLTAESIQQQALLFLNEKSQADIIALLEKYAPEYLSKGKLLGSQLYGGLKPKIDSILDMIATMRKAVEAPITITVTTVHRDVYEPPTTTPKTTANTAGVQRIVAGIQAFAASPGASIAGMYDRAQRAMDGMLYRSMQPAAVAAQAFAANSRGTSVGQTRSLKVDQTIIMQQPVPSPSQNARALRRESERLAKMLTRR